MSELVIGPKKCSKFEVVVTNNGSTDSTEDIVKKYNDVILVQASKKGVAFARQVALE